MNYQTGAVLVMTSLPSFDPMSISEETLADAAHILEALAALGRQAGAGPYEVIVADRLADATTREIEARFPQVRLLHVPPGTTLPAISAEKKRPQ